MEFFKFLWDNRTTVFGYVQTALGFMIATQGLFNDDVIKWMLFFNGLLTAMLGHYNNHKKAISTGDVPIKRQEGSTRLGMLIMLFSVGVVACAMMPSPHSYTEKVASAYAGVAVANDTAAILLNSGAISKQGATDVLIRTREATTAIDMARELGPTVGGDKLNTALAALRAVTDLMCKGRQQHPNCEYLYQRVEF